MWTDEEDKAAKMLRAHLTSAPVLALPDFDKHFFLTTDASDAAVGVMLSRVHNKRMSPKNTIL